ncbi:HAD family hydrolase [uncultured Megasphaera sp.]|uniref:HAD family hydrolase n=1 Tax=uncultured Megasphaera sp. TaxID=165188 RepID=UPI002598C024|nr:HAD family hydrolase [uncultured Megasphaera sp.]
MMNKIETIIFDLDNTLYNFKYFWEKAHYELYKDLNIKEVDYNTFMKEYLIQDKVLWNDLVAGKIDLNELRIIRPYITFKKLGIDKSRKFCKEFYLRMFDILINEMFIESKINNILSNLKDNYKLYILTNGLKKEQEMKINKLGISKYFENIIISESIGYEKPDLKAFYYLINKFDITPHYTIMIGDSYINDIEPSIKLGFNTLHIDYEKLVTLDYNFNEDILEQFKENIVWS